MGRVLAHSAARLGRLELHTPVGCSHCKQGYKGRIGVYELLVARPAVKQLTRANGTAPQLAEAAQSEGARTLRQDALRKVLAGELDLARGCGGGP